MSDESGEAWRLKSALKGSREKRKSIQTPVEGLPSIAVPVPYTSIVLSFPEFSSVEFWPSYQDDNSKKPIARHTKKKKKGRQPLGRERSKMSLILISNPVDYSFRNATNLMDLTKLKARSVRVRNTPPCAPSGLYLTASIWAGYNELHDMDGLESFVSKLLEIPEALALLDLSFNQICDISEEIQMFPNLKVVQLHSNKIDSFTEIAKLSSLGKLQSVTFKGNPIERRSDYRAIIIKMLPQIKSLDFNLVTPYDLQAVTALVARTSRKK